ncbi:MAG: SdpI family protein [Nocardioides sp.]|nr:SdpI family protein [Nocardioides sp.]
MGPNRIVGIKTRATQASDNAWSAGHRAAQPALLAAALTGLGAAIPLGLSAWLTDASGSVVLTTASALTAVLVLALGGYAVYRANSAARHAGTNGGN